jgi:hypothetical protein
MDLKAYFGSTSFKRLVPGGFSLGFIESTWTALPLTDATNSGVAPSSHRVAAQVGFESII